MISKLQDIFQSAVAQAASYDAGFWAEGGEFLDCWFSEEKGVKFLELYYRLEGSDSKECFLTLLKRRLLVYLAGNREEFNHYSSEEWGTLVRNAQSSPYLKDAYVLDVVETFGLEGYSCKDGDAYIGVMPGDAVIDCGAYTGNTAIYFAKKTGDGGHVYAFEPVPETCQLMAKRIKEFGINNITIENVAIADQSGMTNFLVRNGANAVMTPSEAGISVPVTSIDDYVRTNHIQKIDFIKMDIEGAELSALAGARESIRRFRPKLAICIYHKADDFITIPESISDILPEYRFYMRHNSPGFYETVLFATPGAERETCHISASDAAFAISQWKILKSMTQMRIAEKRRSYLEQLNITLAMRMPAIFGNGVFDSSHRRYVRYYLQQNNDLYFMIHYEGWCLRVGIYFKQDLLFPENIIRSIIKCNNLSLTLKETTGPSKGSYYELINYNDPNFTSDLMLHLARISLPKLMDNHLLSDSVIIKVFRTCEVSEVNYSC